MTYKSSNSNAIFKKFKNKIYFGYQILDLDPWPKNRTDNFKFKNCLFRATSIVKHSDKGKYVYSCYGITFDNTVSWSFNNGTARIFIVLVLIIVHNLMQTIAIIFF